MDTLISKDVQVEMRDGAVLVADVYRPMTADPVPAILYRSPYDKEGAWMPLLSIARSVAAGYAVVIQNTRGRFRSQGSFEPFLSEAADGVDTIEWLIRQPWSDGCVGMAGQSYVGATQWLAASRQPAGLKAIAPQITSSSYYEGWIYRGGALELGLAILWTLANLELPPMGIRVANGEVTPGQVAELMDAVDAISALYDRRPLTDNQVVTGVAPYYSDWLAHPTNDSYWRETAPRERYEDVTVPSLNVGGWYDVFLDGTLENYTGMKERGGGPGARHPRLVIGPWSHGPLTAEFPERAFGLRAHSLAADLIGQQLRFFDRHVKGLENGFDDEPAVRIFVMGVNEWRDEQDWPLPDTDYVPFYLQGDGTTPEGGQLSVEVPELSAPDIFSYDPRDPVPTLGGATFLPGLPIATNAGPKDQRVVEERSDVLCYTSAPLAADMEVIGPVRLTLYASSSATDTDFTGKLVDVYPDERALNLCDGILRARYRSGTDDEELLVQDDVYAFDISLSATANVFLAGHRIRLQVSSSNFPRFDANTNTGNAIASDTDDDLKVATNSVFHDPQYPSHLVLPVIRR